MAKNDDTIKQLMEKVATQKKALGSKPKVSWKTNGVFKFDDKRYVNINTVQTPQPLVEALSFMLNSVSSTVEASKRLGVNTITSNFCGYSIDEWEDDFNMRLNVLKWEEKKNQLDSTQAKLSSLVSEEARTEMELENISKSLVD